MTDQVLIQSQQAEIERLQNALALSDSEVVLRGDERDALQARVADLEKAETQLIDERDSREAVINDLCKAIGWTPEWSSAYGLNDAVEEAQERIAALTALYEECANLRDRRGDLVKCYEQEGIKQREQITQTEARYERLVAVTKLAERWLSDLYDAMVPRSAEAEALLIQIRFALAEQPAPKNHAIELMWVDQVEGHRLVHGALPAEPDMPLFWIEKKGDAFRLSGAFMTHLDESRTYPDVDSAKRSAAVYLRQWLWFVALPILDASIVKSVSVVPVAPDKEAKPGCSKRTAGGECVTRPWSDGKCVYCGEFEPELAELRSIKARYEAAALGKDGQAIIDAWISLGGIVADPALGHLQAALQLHVSALRKDSARLDFVAKQYWNAIRYCCGVDGEEWGDDFRGTLDKRMEREAARAKKGQS